ncbi:MAG: hypothetical protein A2073_01155 [Deltaproteobacteria bacterium GWC2_42_11]|nr:MAG: hypothetical protein A2073_01155 [Deltaproteobacteria bacterium GWC2_42_11]
MAEGEIANCLRCKRWSAIVSGSGTYSGTGILNGSAVQFNGTAEAWQNNCTNKFVPTVGTVLTVP